MVKLDISIENQAQDDKYRVFGSVTSSYSALGISINNSGSMLFYCGNTGADFLYKDDIPNILDRHLWKINFSYFNKGNSTPFEIYMDGVLKKNVQNKFNSSFNRKVPIYIMCNTHSTTSSVGSGMGVVTLYSYKHYKGYTDDKLVMDFVPAISPNGSIGVYEKNLWTIFYTRNW